MSDIRVTYSGLISLIVGAIGTATGLIFILIVTRTLSPQEFGTWGLILILDLPFMDILYNISTTSSTEM